MSYIDSNQQKVGDNMARVNKQAISIGIANEILARVDSESKKLGLNRSSFITMCISQYFKNEEALSLLAQAQDLYEQARIMEQRQQMSFYEQTEQ